MLNLFALIDVCWYFAFLLLGRFFVCMLILSAWSDFHLYVKKVVCIDMLCILFIIIFLCILFGFLFFAL